MRSPRSRSSCTGGCAITRATGTCSRSRASARVLAATFVAEIGDVTRFPTAGALCCWAGLTPRHYESDKTVHRGHISKEGDTLIRWAAVEAIQRQTEPVVKAVKDGIIARRGKNTRNIAKVAAARKMLEVVYYVLRDGQARCLTAAAATAGAA